MLSVFLVDDEPLIRRGIKKLIPWEKYGFKISGEAGDGEEALKMITADNTDIVITDIKMPFSDGLDLSANLKKKFPGIKVIVLTGFDDFPLLQQSIRNGVCDYLLKPVNKEFMLEALFKMKEQIHAGRYSYPFELETNIIMELEQQNEKGAIKQLDSLFDEFIIYKVPFDIICKICKGILLTINRWLDSRGCNLRDILQCDILKEKFFYQYSDKNKIKDALESVCLRVIEHASGSSNRKLIQKIKEYIEKHMHEDITLDIIAARFYLNPSYVSQLFKKETGENYVDFLIDLKMEKAKKLLGNPGLRIQDISDILCYSDAKYFGQLFKRKVGLLPSQYRLINNNED